MIQLSSRERAIIAACVRRCDGWTSASELQRFVNIDAESVRGGFSDEEISTALETLCQDSKPNAHQALVDALRNLVKATEDSDNPADMGVSSHEDVMVAARAALKLAE